MVARLIRFFVIYPLLVIIIGLIILGVWIGTCDPLKTLPPLEYNLAVSRIEPVTGQGRRLEHFMLAGGDLGDIGIIVSLPDPLPAKKLPILVVLGGLGTGIGNIRAITNAGDNAIIGYDWPIPVHFPQGRELIRQSPELYRQVMNIPGQVASAVNWLAAQPWADDQRISMLGFSLGALALPAAENLTEHGGRPVGWTILAYGGAPLGDLFTANPHMQAGWMRSVMGPLIDILLHPVEPTVNLPSLSGHFLVLEGSDDMLIPASARTHLREAVPDPKDVIIFNGDHMGVGPEKQALLEEIIRTSRDWLIRNKAGNP